MTSLVTPTPKHSLISGVVIKIDIRLVCFWRICIYTLSLVGSFFLVLVLVLAQVLVLTLTLRFGFALGFTSLSFYKTSRPYS